MLGSRTLISAVVSRCYHASRGPSAHTSDLRKKEKVTANVQDGLNSQVRNIEARGTANRWTNG
jgi:hypothetical protein